MGRTAALLKKPRSGNCTRLAVVAIVALASGFAPSQADASTSYTYDDLSRLTTALYDNGICIAYGYDANGNRTQAVAQTNTAVWGSGLWGCFVWTPH
jgi:YD repeat-containing protein